MTDVVQIGDLIYLEGEASDNEKLTVCGTRDGSKAVALDRHAIRSSMADFSAQSIFIVQGQTTWSRLQAYKTLLEREGLDKLQGMTHKETRHAYLDCLAEREQAEREFARTKGREVRYGNVIQLLHESTGKFLSTSRQSTQNEGGQAQGGNSVLLDDDAGQSGWFRVMPRLRVHNEGERVREGDPVVLVAVENGNRLSMSPRSSDLITKDEDGEAGDDFQSQSTTFKMNLYRSVEEAAMQTTLLCGQAYTLYHQELDALLHCDAAKAKAGCGLTMSAAPSLSGSGSGRLANSCSIWQVQHREEMSGGACKWDDVIRLRHVCSGRFLCLRPESSDGFEMRLVNAAEAEVGANAEDTLFKFVPRYANEEGVIDTQLHFVSLASFKHPAFVHAFKPGHDMAAAAAPSGSQGSSPVPFASNSPSRGLTPAPDGATSVAAPSGGSDPADAVQVTASLEKKETDTFALRAVERNALHDLLKVCNALSPFEQFLQQVQIVAVTQRESNPRPVAVKADDEPSPAALEVAAAASATAAESAAAAAAAARAAAEKAATAVDEAAKRLEAATAAAKEAEFAPAAADTEEQKAAEEKAADEKAAHVQELQTALAVAEDAAAAAVEEAEMRSEEEDEAMQAAEKAKAACGAKRKPPRKAVEGSTAPVIGLGSIHRTVEELIRFVTRSDNPDPFTREGMPIQQRQRTMCEQGILGLAIACVEAPFESGLYAHEDIDSQRLAQDENHSAQLLQMRSFAVLAMRLVRHILREEPGNKMATLALVPALLRLLPCGVGAAEVLSELFTDNDMVDKVGARVSP